MKTLSATLLIAGAVMLSFVETPAQKPPPMNPGDAVVMEKVRQRVTEIEAILDESFDIGTIPVLMFSKHFEELQDKAFPDPLVSGGGADRRTRIRRQFVFINMYLGFLAWNATGKVKPGSDSDEDDAARYNRIFPKEFTAAMRKSKVGMALFANQPYDEKTLSAREIEANFAAIREANRILAAAIRTATSGEKRKAFEAALDKLRQPYSNEDISECKVADDCP